MQKLHKVLSVYIKVCSYLCLSTTKPTLMLFLLSEEGSGLKKPNLQWDVNASWEGTRCLCMEKLLRQLWRHYRNTYTWKAEQDVSNNINPANRERKNFVMSFNGNSIEDSFLKE